MINITLTANEVDTLLYLLEREGMLGALRDRLSNAADEQHRHKVVTADPPLRYRGLVYDNLNETWINTKWFECETSAKIHATALAELYSSRVNNPGRYVFDSVEMEEMTDNDSTH